MITVEPTKLDGVCLIRPNRFGDNRGWFMESYSKKDFEEVRGMLTELYKELKG
jgi:dTDP-4-dehydrorhamnose 3,5-epimerase